MVDTSWKIWFLLDFVQWLHQLKATNQRSDVGHISIVDKSSAYGPKGPVFIPWWRQEFISFVVKILLWNNKSLKLKLTLWVRQSHKGIIHKFPNQKFFDHTLPPLILFFPMPYGLCTCATKSPTSLFAWRHLWTFPNYLYNKILKPIFYPPASKAIREVANFIERRNEVL